MGHKTGQKDVNAGKGFVERREDDRREGERRKDESKTDENALQLYIHI